MECDSGTLSKSSFKLLQPDLMTVEELGEILRTYCVKKDLTSFNKSELVELFRRVALPLPQRIYSGRSRREMLLTKNQELKALEGGKLIKRSDTTTNGLIKKSSPHSCTSTSSSPKVLPPSIPSINSRIKPPVNSNNYTKKVLKLALKKPLSSDDSLDSKRPNAKLDGKSNINGANSKDESKSQVSVIPADNRPATNGKHKRIVIDFSDSSTKSTKTPKLVNLKRPTSHDEVVNPGQKVRKIVPI